MSITNDIRAYADSVLEQGKHVVGQAQHQFTAVGDLRAQAEKTLNIDAIKTAVEPYLAQAKQYRSTVTDRAEGLFETVRSDKRVAKVIGTAEALSSTVIDTVNDRIVKPVSSLTGIGAKPVTKKKPAAKSTKPASTRPAAKSTAKKAPTKSASARKSTAAKKTTAKKATSSSQS